MDGDHKDEKAPEGKGEEAAAGPEGKGDDPDADAKKGEDLKTPKKTSTGEHDDHHHSDEEDDN